VTVLAVLIGHLLMGCGTSESGRVAIAGTSQAAAGPAPAEVVVVKVGVTPITGALYNHWMAVGAATVELPKPTGPVPQPIDYAPPHFTACVKHLQISAPKSITTGQLRSRCETMYQGIQQRILNFLISGYWLRGEAAERHISVTEAAVRKKFEEEKRANYRSAAAFRRLQEASRQTIPDLMFAVETRMLSAKLLETFARTHGHEKPERVIITAFNKAIRGRWTPKTDCQPGYVVPDCAQQHTP
jgi:hypothetical protein